MVLQGDVGCQQRARIPSSPGGWACSSVPVSFSRKSVTWDVRAAGDVFAVGDVRTAGGVRGEENVLALGVMLASGNDCSAGDLHHVA